MPSRKAPASSARLGKYRDKRRASATAEPFGATPKDDSSIGRLFVVQQHRARHLHFDLRLEIDGVLRSWAVPKGPSADPADKRFAALVEDHPIEYADFEGAIAPGNYGAGYVIVWDRGIWTPLNDVAQGWQKGKLLFDLHGHKLRGRWTLVRMRKTETEWLLIKERDDQARDAAHRYSDESILSGLTLAEAADPLSRAKKLLRSLKQRAIPKLRANRTVPTPMLASATASAGEAFDRKGWIFEFKYDGYRVLAEKSVDGVRLLSRNGLSLTEQFPDIAKAVGMLPYEQLLIDGELVVNDVTGRPSFSALQARAALANRSQIVAAGRHQPATFYAFDLIEAIGYDLRELELVERKRVLARVLPTVGPIRYSEHIDETGRAAFAAAQRLGIEGVVGKRAASRYQSGRSADWIKVRARRTGDFVIVGWTPARSNRSDIGALILAEYRSGKLTPVGRVGSGLSGARRDEVQTLLRQLPPGEPLDDDDGHWVKPERVCEVAFREYTAAGHLRQPVFVRLRTDKRPEECIGQFDEPAPTPPVKADQRRVEVSHRDKVFFPELGLTKGDLVDYYDAIAPWMLPYLEDRPLVLTRFPDGIHGKSFYQRDAPEFVPEWIRRETLWSEGAEREVHYFIVDDASSLRYLINLGTIPIHTWHSRVSDLEHPDWCVLDLDPKDAPFASVIAVARAIRDLALELDLPAYLKTSGASGLHVLIPLANQLTHDQARTFSHVLARVIVDRCPEIATIVRSVRRRDRKVYIDYLQNGHGRLLVAPFSARAEPSAGVSMPLRWEELTSRLRNDRFNIKNAVRRMRSQKQDPWHDFIGQHADLARILNRLSSIAR
jgi:bifunctional non-homologous end joining protein LigD